MNGRAVRTAVARAFGVALVIAAVAGLLYAASRGATDGDAPSYWESVAIVSLVGLAGWGYLAVRSQVRRQDGSILELVPPQPGDANMTARGAARTDAAKTTAAARSVASVEERLKQAPAELVSLHAAVHAAGASPDAYEDRLRPRLRELATVRAATSSRQADVEALTDLRKYLPAPGGLRGTLMRLRFYRRRVVVRGIAAIVGSIEEL